MEISGEVKRIKVRLTGKDKYSIDLRQTILDIARKNYEKKCNFGVYIKSVDKILSFTPPEFTSLLITDAHSYVEMEVTTFVYNEGDIIPDVKINVLPNNVIVGENAHGKIRVIMDKKSISTKYLTKGSTLPMQLKNVSYEVGSDHMIIMAKLPVNKKKLNIVYRIIKDDVCSGVEEKCLKKLEADISHNIGIIKKLSGDEKRIIVHFANWMYPYKTKQNFAKTHQAKKLKMSKQKLTVENLTSGHHLIMIAHQEPNDDTFYASNTPYQDAKPMKLFAAAHMLLVHRFKYLRSIITLTKTYNTLEKFKKLFPLISMGIKNKF